MSNTMRPQQLGSVEIDDTALTVYLVTSEPPAVTERGGVRGNTAGARSRLRR